MDKLSNNKNKTLAFNLQAERMSSFARQNKSSTLELHVNYFKSVMFLVSKRLDRDIRTIENGLNDLKKNELIIKDYKRRGDVFILDFFPLTNEEKKDLIPKNAEFLTNDNSIMENWLTIEAQS